MNFEVSTPIGALRQKAKYTMKTTNKSVLSIGLTALLTACGGGGGGDAALATPAAQTPQAATTVVNVTATHTPGGEEANAFSLLNKARTECGFGSLTQNPHLDRAAVSHSLFLTVNGLQYGHSEAAGLPGFTGVSPTDRAQAAGYSFPTSEDVAIRSSAPLADGMLRTTREVAGLLAAPYHSINLLDQQADLGVGFSQVRAPASVGIAETEKIALVFKLGIRAGVNDLAPDSVYTYPCQSTAGQPVTLPNEFPSLIPLALAQDYRLYGSPVIVKV